MTSDHDAALDRILGIMLQITGYDEGLLLLHTAPFYVKKAVRGKHAQACREATVAENDPTIKAVTESKSPLFLTDIDLKYFDIPAVARTLLGIPVIFQEEATAIVIMYSDDLERKVQYRSRGSGYIHRPGRNSHRVHPPLLRGQKISHH